MWIAPHVREAFAGPVCDLRHPRFTEAYAEVRAGVRRALAAPDHAVVLAAGSGSFGVELVLRACLGPGDRVLAVVSGAYGERMARMAELAGATVDRVTSELGCTPTAAEVARALTDGGELPAGRASARSVGRYGFVTIVHVEPSTGTQVDLSGVAAACREAGAVPIVDAICSAFALELDCAADGLGAVVTASQKGLALPPGMAIAAVAPELVERARATPEERTGFYGRLDHWIGEGFVFTPPMAHVFAARASLAHIAAETLPARAERHRSGARTVRDWALARGIAPVASREHAAQTLTALYYPPGRDDAWLRWLRDARGVELAPATERRIAGRAFRIGHLGDLPPEHLAAGLAALERALLEER